MEKRDRPYSVEPYNPEWVQKYEKEKEIIKNILGDKVLSIEHIGSTSVKGMWAKPQIDILVIVELLKDVDDFKEEMEEAGYIYEEKFEKYNERYFTRDASSGERLVSIHIREKNNPQNTPLLYFRDYLRAHPEAAKEYSEVKRKAYEKGADRVEYIKEKRDVFKKLLKKAKEWYEERA
jgi:GrpB-like predicted nucleotidyltransferase (UPF0157 family)